MAKVVLIDDEPRLLETLARFLERKGLEVVRAHSFADADEHLRPGRFDVLVTDIVMPEFSGMMVLKEVVEARGCQEPVILITGEPNLETASAAVRIGAFDYVQKPVTKDRLLEVVDRGLRHVRLLRERDQARTRELQLLKNLAEIGESASVLSHEIKTPITGLRHALHAVGDKLGVGDSVLIDEFLQNLSRIERMLGETLSFAKPLEPKWAVVGLAEVVEAAFGQCRELDVFAGMTHAVEIDPALRLRVDGQMLGKVFENLFRNAAEACSGDGRIEVRAARFEGEIHVDVTDDGPGVPVGMRSEIFKPFHSSKDYGTGIGLAFTRKVVEAHGGQIDLVSSPSGACFRVGLPTDLIADPSDPVTEPPE